MKLGLVVVSNGRGELLRQTMQAIQDQVTPAPDVTLMCDDSGDAAFGRWMQERWPSARHDPHRHMGHGPAVSRAWRKAGELGTDWLLWMEEDMSWQQPIDLRAVAAVMDAAGVVQMAFRRNAHFPAELAAGPTQIDRFSPALLQDQETNGWPWLQHRLFYTLNPHLVRTSFLREHRWPAIPNSEHHFSVRLFRDPRVKVGLWGSRQAPPIVRHNGTMRTGSGY